MKASDAQRLKALRAATGLAPKSLGPAQPAAGDTVPAVYADLP
jgi:hypothetical protein